MKKILGIVLACALLLGLMGVVSFADNTFSKETALVSVLQDERVDPAIRLDADANGGVSIEQSSIWTPWIMYYTEDAVNFEPNPGETLYLVYDFTVPEDTTVQITLNGWNNAVSADIGGANTGVAEGGSAATILSGTYKGAIPINKSDLGESGRFGVVGTNVAIRSLKLASGAAGQGETSTPPVSVPENSGTTSTPAQPGETADLITQITNGTVPSDPTVITDTGSGFVITQNGGWNVWILYFSDDAALFASQAGDDLYLEYDMTINGNGHLCMNEWNHSIAAAIAAAQGVDTVPGEEGGVLLAEGTYTGRIPVDASIFGETGRLGIAGTGATIRTFRFVSSASGDTSTTSTPSTPSTESSVDSSAPGQGTKGDVNHDNSVDMKDVLIIRKYIAKLADTIDEWAADVNSDDNVDMKDVLLMRKYIAHLIDSFDGGSDVSKPDSSVDPTSAPTSTDPTVVSQDQSEEQSQDQSQDQSLDQQGPVIGPDGSFFDDFNTGVDPDLWYISTQAWGGATNGEKAENVNYTADGELVLTAHGNLYQGTIGGRDGSRTGACLVSKEILGPGSYEVKMKCLPRLGTCTAMWTYFNDGGRNHEIDIELPGNTDTFKYSLFTNWLTTYNYISQNTIPDYYHNDGEWHTYRFDWHTSPARIEYYVDGKLEMTDNTKVPTAAGRFWVGVWLPNEWCGEPDFETAHMLVDYVKYSPYDEPYEATNFNYRSAAPLDAYPQAPIALPVNNYVANGSFDNDLYAWTISGASVVAGNDGKAVSLDSASSSVSQVISSMDAKGLYRFTADAKVASAGGKATLTIEPIAQNKRTVLGSYTIEYTGTAPETKSLDVTMPNGTAYVRITLSGSAGSVFDHLYLTQPSRGDF